MTRVLSNDLSSDRRSDNRSPRITLWLTYTQDYCSSPNDALVVNAKKHRSCVCKLKIRHLGLTSLFSGSFPLKQLNSNPCKRSLNEHNSY
jgi:hypothetical protein